MLELPAAIAYTIPRSAERFTAASNVEFGKPPMLMFATAGRMAFAVTQSTPLIATEVEEITGSQVVTLTAVIGAPGTTPTTARSLSIAARTPDTLVPWAHVAAFVALVKFTWFATL